MFTCEQRQSDSVWECSHVDQSNENEEKKKQTTQNKRAADKPREYSVIGKHTFLVAVMAEYPRGFSAATPHGWFGPCARRNWHFATTEWKSLSSLLKLVKRATLAAAVAGFFNHWSSGCQAFLACVLVVYCCFHISWHLHTICEPHMWTPHVNPKYEPHIWTLRTYLRASFMRWA